MFHFALSLYLVRGTHGPCKILLCLLDDTYLIAKRAYVPLITFQRCAFCSDIGKSLCSVASGQRDLSIRLSLSFRAFRLDHLGQIIHR